MEDTKDTNDWGGESERDGGWDRHSDYDSGSRDRYSRSSNVKPGDWECTSCQFNNFASRTACFKCRAPKDGDSSPFGGGGRMGGGGGGGGGMRDMRPGDWCCPKCQFHNFSSRAMCYKCNSSRGGGGDDRFSSPRGMSRPGEWDCPRCQFSNFSHRDYCFKCRTPREGGRSGGGGGGGGGGGMDGPRGGMRAGDWECHQCQFHNFASRDQCFKCSSPK